MCWQAYYSILLCNTYLSTPTYSVVVNYLYDEYRAEMYVCIRETERERERERERGLMFFYLVFFVSNYVFCNYMYVLFDCMCSIKQQYFEQKQYRGVFK